MLVWCEWGGEDFVVIFFCELIFFDLFSGVVYVV